MNLLCWGASAFVSAKWGQEGRLKTGWVSSQLLGCFCHSKCNSLAVLSVSWVTLCPTDCFRHIVVCPLLLTQNQKQKRASTGEGGRDRQERTGQRQPLSRSRVSRGGRRRKWPLGSGAQGRGSRKEGAQREMLSHSFTPTPTPASAGAGPRVSGSCWVWGLAPFCMAPAPSSRPPA